MFRWGLSRSNFCFAMKGRSPYSLFAADPGDDLLGDRLGHLLVRVELHRVRGSALSARAQVGSVTEHLREGHLCLDNVAGAALLHALDATAPRREVANDVTHVVLRGDDLDR